MYDNTYSQSIKKANYNDDTHYLQTAAKTNAKEYS